MKYFLSRILIKLKFSHINPVCWGQNLVMSMLRWDAVTVRCSGASIGPSPGSNPVTDQIKYYCQVQCDSGSSLVEHGKNKQGRNDGVPKSRTLIVV